MATLTPHTENVVASNHEVVKTVEHTKSNFFVNLQPKDFDSLFDQIVFGRISTVDDEVDHRVTRHKDPPANVRTTGRSIVKAAGGFPVNQPRHKQMSATGPQASSPRSDSSQTSAVNMQHCHGSSYSPFPQGRREATAGSNGPPQTLAAFRDHVQSMPVDIKSGKTTSNATCRASPKRKRDEIQDTAFLNTHEQFLKLQSMPQKRRVWYEKILRRRMERFGIAFEDELAAFKHATTTMGEDQHRYREDQQHQRCDDDDKVRAMGYDELCATPPMSRTSDHVQSSPVFAIKPNKFAVRRLNSLESEEIGNTITELGIVSDGKPGMPRIESATPSPNTTPKDSLLPPLLRSTTLRWAPPVDKRVRSAKGEGRGEDAFVPTRNPLAKSM